MINQLGIKLYSATEVSSLLGISRETLLHYSKRAGVQDRRISRVRYYTEEEIRKILQVPGENTKR